MGVYHLYANLDKHEWIDPGHRGGSVKHRGTYSGPAPGVLAHILGHRWAGDRVQVVADDRDQDFYYDIHESPLWRDVSADAWKDWEDCGYVEDIPCPG